MEGYGRIKVTKLSKIWMFSFEFLSFVFVSALESYRSLKEVLQRFLHKVLVIVNVLR